MSKIIIKIFKNIKPFRFVYSSKKKLFIIGVAFSKKYDYTQATRIVNHLVFFYGTKYKHFYWI